MISDEIERASNPDDNSDIDLFSSTNNKSTDIEEETVEEADTNVQSQSKLYSTNDLVAHVPAFLTKETVEELRLEDELQELYTGFNSKSKYVWLANLGKPSYSFGGRSYEPHDIHFRVGIKTLMDKFNHEYNLQLDSCLITRYKSGEQSLSLHQDNEAILDGSHPIVVTSIGSSRTLQFWDSGSEHSGTLMKEVRIVQGDLLIMKPHCQDVLWHNVLPNYSTSRSGIRYALSFRRMANATSSNQQEQQPELPHLITSSPVEKDLEPHPKTGFMVHPSRLQQQQQQQQPSVKANTLTTPLADNNNSNKNHARHLIIGDSMVNGLHVSGSTCIFRGGIRPHEVLGLLPSSMDLLHPKHYDDVRSVTLVVGTNALNISYPSKATPLLDVVDDYERLVDDLRKLFPNARIGLYNVLPRVYRYEETRERIELFNSIFELACRRMKGIFWIRQYMEFIDHSGNLRQDLQARNSFEAQGESYYGSCY